jgi:hypothetical protein
MLYIDLNNAAASTVLSFDKDLLPDGCSFVQTVWRNMEGFTRREVEEAREARKVQAMIGHPTNCKFLGMVCAKMITDCPITEQAIKNAHTIFGPNLAGVRGRTVWRPPNAVRTDYVQIPWQLLDMHRLVTLMVDVMVNGVPFLVSVACRLNLVTVEYIPLCTAKYLAKCIQRMMDLYSRGGFMVGMVLMDNEFKKLRNLVPILAINTTAAKEHVPEVERKIRLIKEGGRDILNTLPFKKLPWIVLIELIYHVLLWLNAFPALSSVSETLSPCKIVMRHKLNFLKHAKATFGLYCEVHDEPSPSNNMAMWTTPAIVLGLIGNLQGTCKFLSLTTGKKVKRWAFTGYPMLDSVIRMVERLAETTARAGEFNFGDQNGILFEWNDKIDKTPERILEADNVVPYPSMVTKFPGVELSHNQRWEKVRLVSLSLGFYFHP